MTKKLFITLTVDVVVMVDEDFDLNEEMDTAEARISLGDNADVVDSQVTDAKITYAK